MIALLAPLAAGILFGVGLVVSQMVDPAKVLAFLDVGGIPAGAWDPSLAFVMAGALAATAIGYRLAFGRGRPLAAAQFNVPTGTAIDARLVAGAALFGTGWGLAGYCPGPALAGLAFGRGETFVFVAAMIAGMMLYRATFEAKPPAVAPAR